MRFFFTVQSNARANFETCCNFLFQKQITTNEVIPPIKTGNGMNACFIKLQDAKVIRNSHMGALQIAKHDLQKTLFPIRKLQNISHFQHIHQSNHPNSIICIPNTFTKSGTAIAHINCSHELGGKKPSDKKYSGNENVQSFKNRK